MRGKLPQKMRRNRGLDSSILTVIKKAPEKSLWSFSVSGAEGQNFNRLGRSNAPEVYPPLEDAQAADTGIFRRNFWTFKNVVISNSWFYSTFSTYFWFRLELFGNIWHWRAQLGTVQCRSSLSFIKPIFHSKRSAWLPVRTRHSSLPSIRYIRSQSGSMWHSRQSFNVPFNLWSLVSGGSFSPSTNSCTVVLSLSKSSFRFLSRLTSLLNWVSRRIDRIA